jgi:nucleoid DNA-binding protein
VEKPDFSGFFGASSLTPRANIAYIYASFVGNSRVFHGFKTGFREGGRMAKVASGKKAMTKTEIYSAIAERAGLSRKQVASVFEGLQGLISNSLGKKGAGIFTVPGLLKLKVVRKPATKEREGVNPFTGEKMIFKAKPARNVVKALPLKNLKQMV